MPQQNLIEVKIPESDLAEIRTAMASLTKTLMPHLKTLTAQERQEVPKMGDRTVAFVQKALEYSKQYPELVPAYLDVQAMHLDLNAVGVLRELSRSLTSLTDAVTDSITLSGSEAYQGALVFYSNVKNAAKVKAHNAAAVYDDLSARFPGSSSKAKA